MESLDNLTMETTADTSNIMKIKDHVGDQQNKTEAIKE